MHPWLESIVNVCRNRKNDNMVAFDDDPLATSINLQRHCYGEFSSAAVQANTSMEDQSQVEVASKSALFLGVYDGHGGVDASRFLCEHLFDNLLRIANENENTITQATLSNAVSATEDGFLDFVKTNYIVDPNLGKVGSCCLAGIIWKGTLHVANLGDSRAVIGTMINKKIHAEQLTRDHNCNDQAIREELKSMHLDDPTIVMEKNGAWRVKGIIMVSRTIGDAYLKRPEFTLCESFPKFQKVPEPFTRGVVSAEPEMRSRVLTDSDKFLIFASDGLWDLMSNEEAAEIVQKNPRNGIAKRLLSTALAEAASRREVTYRNMMAADPGRDSRRTFHDDISVIVVFLDKTSFLRKRVRNLSYKGSSDMPTLSAFAWSGLTTSRLQLMNPKRLKESINSRFKSGSSHASSSQAQGLQSPPIPLSRNPQTPEAEDSQSVSLLGQSSRAQSRWKNVELKFSPKRKSI